MAKSLSLLIRRLVWVVLGIVLVFFAVNNRADVAVSFDPLFGSYAIPIYIILFAGIFIGLMVAAVVTSWLRLEGFTKRRKAERRADYLDDQMSAMAEDAHQVRSTRAHNAASEDVGENSSSTGQLAKLD
ncbi:MAG: hypothetical protein COB37_01995 [Kordiimonadales bacterium]|nr:MAG: hypothetical protein COB37_01995 [Kordiimonadales bacterium]